MNLIRMMFGVAIIGLLGIVSFFIIGYLILPIVFIGVLGWGINALYMRVQGIHSNQNSIHILHPKHRQKTSNDQQKSKVIDVEYTEV